MLMSFRLKMILKNVILESGNLRADIQLLPGEEVKDEGVLVLDLNGVRLLGAGHRGGVIEQRWSVVHRIERCRRGVRLCPPPPITFKASTMPSGPCSAQTTAGW